MYIKYKMKRKTNFLYLAAILILFAFFGYVLLAFNLKEGVKEGRTQGVKTFTLTAKNGHYSVLKSSERNISKDQLKAVRRILNIHNLNVDKFKDGNITKDQLSESWENLRKQVSEIVGPELKN